MPLALPGGVDTAEAVETVEPLVGVEPEAGVDVAAADTGVVETPPPFLVSLPHAATTSAAVIPSAMILFLGRIILPCCRCNAIR